MTDRWQQIEKICQSALELEESQRAAFLDQACAGDEELRREVESLLQFETRGDRFIEEPAVEVAAKMIAHEKPESLVGQRLGSYQILALLGTGGMGVVYKARDTRLNRSVAIKMLPPDQLSDPERKGRFIQEARAASALNHPNIITIHDIGSEGGVDFIVMEYVEGKTLDQRIPRKGMRLSEALKVAIQIADALAKAHSAGIIHRDLKPGNVMVTDSGQVKVLDFGLAKLLEKSTLSELDGTETLAAEAESLTEKGVILGTVAYMSPEQAEGKKLDTRSDIFSFGSVLYEMVTGQKAFEGDSKMSTLATILNKNPKPVIEINPVLPPELERIINHCLRKDPGRRFQDMVNLKVELEELKEASDSGKPGDAAASKSASQGDGGHLLALQRRRIWVWSGIALVVVAIAASIWLFRGTAKKPALAMEVVPLTSYPGIQWNPSFSPDGNQVVFSWNGEKQDNFDIYVKLIGSPTPVRLTTDPADDLSPAFSPDGRTIGFVRISKGHATFIVIPAIGGVERVVAEVDIPQILTDIEFGFGPFFAWLPDGKWVVTDGLALLSIDTGEMRTLTTPPMKSSLDLYPAASPDGRIVAFTRSTNIDDWEIYLLDLTDDLKPKGEPRRLNSLMAVSFGPAWSQDGREIIFGSNSSADFGTGMGLWKVPAFGAGQLERLPLGAGEACCAAVSPSGNRMVYMRTLFDANIWRLSLSRTGVASAPAAKFIASTRAEYAPQYSPDGKRIAFESLRSGPHGIWVCDADGANAVDLVSQAGATAGTARWSPDGQRIAFDFKQEGNPDIYVIRAGGGKPIRLTTDSAYDAAPSWSGGGKWVYFTSNRTGRYEVWKVSPGGGENIQVTRNGGGTAFESLDGKSLFYTKGDESGSLWKMPVDGGEESQVLSSVQWRAFSLVNEGIYFIPDRGSDRKCTIQFLSFASGKVKTVATMSGVPREGLSVSPDGHSLLFSQNDQAGSDLMLVENFK